MGPGCTAAGIASETGLPLPLVALEMRRQFANGGRKSGATESQGHVRTYEAVSVEGSTAEERTKEDRIRRKARRYKERGIVRGTAARRAAEQVVAIEDKILARVRGS